MNTGKLARGEWVESAISDGVREPDFAGSEEEG